MRKNNQFKSILICVVVAFGAMMFKDKIVSFLPKIPVVGDMLVKVLNPKTA